MTRADDDTPHPSPSPSPDTDALTVSLRTARIALPDTARIALADFAAMFPSTTPLPFHPNFPHRIGAYEVRREVGRGGVGIVFEAFDPRLRRRVAVKVLKDAGPSDRDLLQRFRTEAEAVAQLQHPHIVQVIEVGSHDGAPFVALEYLAGGSLYQKIAGQPQPPRGAAELVRTLAAATAHAHAHGVLHRDLKPGNILFTADGTPKVTDFGSARLFEPGQKTDSNDPGLTLAGEVIGTPQYMAPEQARGTPDEVGPPADVYALGAILYELLTGRPPFTGVDAYDVIHAVRTRDPIPPRNLQPKLPRDLETVCLKCLEKDPKRRYASAEELANDLTRYLAGDTIRARPAGLGRRLWVRAKRHPAGAGMIAGLVVAGLVGLSAFVWQFSETVAALDSARKNYLAAVAKTDEADLANLETEREKAEAEKNLKTANWNLYRGTIAQARLLIEKANTTDAGTLLDEVDQAVRGWEWGFLRRLSGDSLWQFSFPDSLPAAGVSWVHNQALSPDGTRLAVATMNPYDVPGRDKIDNPCTLAVFRVADGKLTRTIVGALPSSVTNLFWSSDRIVTGIDIRGNVRSWDADEGTVVSDRPNRPPFFPLDAVTNVDAGHILRTDSDGTVEILDPLKPRPVAVVRTGSEGMYGYALSPDRSRLVAVTRNGLGGQCRERIYDLPSGRVLAEWFGLWTQARFSPDGRWLLTAPCDGRFVHLTIRDAKTLAVAWEKALPASSFEGCRFSPDGVRAIVVLQGYGEMRAFDVATGENPAVFRGYEGHIRDLAFSPDGSWLVTVGDDNLVRLWNPATGASLAVLRGHTRGVRACTFTADGRTVITGGADERLFCWDLTRTRTAGGVMPPHSTGGRSTRIGALGYTSRGTLAVLQTDVGMTEFDPATANPVARRTFDSLHLRDAKEYRDFTFSADGTRLAGRTKLGPDIPFGPFQDDVDVAIWDVDSGRKLRAHKTGFYRLFTVALSPDGTRLAAGGFRLTKKGSTPDFRLLIWDGKTGAPIADLPTDVPVIGLAFAATDNRLAAGMLRQKKPAGSAIRVFDKAGKPVRDFPCFAPQDPDEHYAYVNALEFSPDGKTLVGSCWGAAILFAMDAETAAVRKTIPMTTAITGLAFSPDGSRFATTGYTDLVSIRDAKTWDIVTNFVCAPGRVDDWAFPALVAFSPDGRTLAATHWDGTFSIWHAPEHSDDAAALSAARRDLSDRSTFHFHLLSARAAATNNRPYAYHFHADHLAKLAAPSAALRDDWETLKAEVSPMRILAAVAGAMASTEK